MAVCTLKTDHPIRVQFGSGLAVHAAQKNKYGGFHTTKFSIGGGSETKYVEPTTRIYVACGRWHVDKKHIVANTTSITCKKCAKKLGFIEHKVSPKRFVVKNNETGEYYKKGCSNWVEDILDATFYKMKAVAEKKTEMTCYRDGGGNEISRDEFFNHSHETRTSKGMRIGRKKSSKYDVRTVTITID